MPLDIQPQYPGAIAYARRPPRDGRNLNRVEARPAAGCRRAGGPPRRVGTGSPYPTFAALAARVGRLPRTLWSGFRRARERTRIAAAWTTIDDRTLRDIGIPPRPLRRISQSWQYWR